MATLWTERTIEESGSRLADRVCETVERCIELTRLLEGVEAYVAERECAWWRQTERDGWEGFVGSIEEAEATLVELVREMGRTAKAVKELREQGVV
jgi:hypothetical protein